MQIYSINLHCSGLVLAYCLSLYIEKHYIAKYTIMHNGIDFMKYFCYYCNL